MFAQILRLVYMFFNQKFPDLNQEPDRYWISEASTIMIKKSQITVNNNS